MVADVKQSRAFLNASLLQNWLNRLGPVLGLLLVIGIFSILMDTPGRFLSPNNLRIVLSQTVIVAIGAIGMTLIIISGGIDLAVGSTIALTGVITALGINGGLPPSVGFVDRHSRWRTGWRREWTGDHAAESRSVYRDARNARRCDEAWRSGWRISRR